MMTMAKAGRGADLFELSQESRGQSCDEIMEVALRMVPVGKLMASSTPFAASLAYRRPLVRCLFATLGLIIIFAQPQVYYSGVDSPTPSQRLSVRVFAGITLQTFSARCKHSFM